MYGMGALGITAGAHRLWAHRSYKAKLPLKILLAIFNSMAFQVSIQKKYKIQFLSNVNNVGRFEGSTNNDRNPIRCGIARSCSHCSPIILYSSPIIEASH